MIIILLLWLFVAEQGFERRKKGETQLGETLLPLRVPQRVVVVVVVLGRYLGT